MARRARVQARGRWRGLHGAAGRPGQALPPAWWQVHQHQASARANGRGEGSSSGSAAGGQGGSPAAKGGTAMRGSIKPLSKGKWRVKWDAPKGADGTRRQHEHRFSGTKAQAEAFLAEQIAAQTTGAYVEPSKLTVKGYLEQWLQGYAAANTTIRTQQGYREKARYLIEG